MPNHFELWTKKPWKFTNSSGPGKEAYISAGNSMLIAYYPNFMFFNKPEAKMFSVWTERSGLGLATMDLDYAVQAVGESMTNTVDE